MANDYTGIRVPTVLRFERTDLGEEGAKGKLETIDRARGKHFLISRDVAAAGSLSANNAEIPRTLHRDPIFTNTPREKMPGEVANIDNTNDHYIRASINQR